MITKNELVELAEKLYEIKIKYDIYGYYPAGKEIQMTAKTFVELFPEETFKEYNHPRYEGKTEYSVMYNGVKFLTLCDAATMEKYRKLGVKSDDREG